MLQTDPPDLVADDLDLTLEQVEAAARFEQDLTDGRGLAA